MKTHENEYTGTVIEAFRDARFDVQFDFESPKESKIVRCFISGKMRMNRINVLVGDKVLAVLQPDFSLGRITRRL